MQKILITAEHFYPAFQGGGPIESITNLIQLLPASSQVFVLSSAYDLNQSSPLQNTVLNQWHAVTVYNRQVNAYYATSFWQACKGLWQQRNISCWYINGVFHPVFSIMPLVAAKCFTIPKVVNAPRGMLQQGAVQQKSPKKKLFLTITKFLGVYKNAWFHATDEQELADIATQLAVPATQVQTIANVVQQPLPNAQPITKQVGHLQLVYLSIVTPKKQLHKILEALAHCQQRITLHVYGPIKEADYGQTCDALAKRLPQNCEVVFCGALPPVKVLATFQQYHASILLSAGENFGHALYQSLAAGVPVITSYFTPWQNLVASNAGWNWDANAPAESIALQLDELALMDDTQWQPWYAGAANHAISYFQSQQLLPKYQQLFALNTVL